MNLSDQRKQWHEALTDGMTREVLQRDTDRFLHQALSTPCLDVLASSDGVQLTSLAGKTYIDFHGNNVHQVGFSHPVILRRITEQLGQLSFSTRRYTNEPAIRFAEKLASLLPSDLNRVLLTPNGSSAVGMALKLARAVTGKFKVVSFWDAFHGASLDAISVGGEAVFREYMGPLMPGVERVPPPVTYRGIFEGREEKCLEYLEYVFSRENDIGVFIITRMSWGFIKSRRA